MAGSTTTVRSRRWKNATESRRSGAETWSSDCDSANVAFAPASALSRGAPNGSGEHRFRSSRCRSRAPLSLSDSDNMSAEPEILNRESAVIRGSRLSLERDRTDPLFRSNLKSTRSIVGTASALNDNRRVQAPSGIHSNGTGVIENGIDLMRGSALDRALAFTGMEREPTVGTCAICGRPLTQVGPKGECLRCLADLGFLSGSQEPGRSETTRRLTPGPLKDDYFEVIEQSARALAAAEACGGVHRDIKPSNIMLESDPSGAPIVKVIDYGVAKVLAPEAERGAEQTQTGFIGTPAFASPEQFAQSGETRLDTRSDIYSLGVTFWYLLSGRVPFVGRTLREVAAKQAEELPLEQLKNAHVPARVIALLESMLAVDPAKRPQSARELLSAVYRCYAKYSAEARSRRRRSTLAAVGATLLIPAIALGAWLYHHAQTSAEMDRSIAVLPLEHLTPNGEDTYFTVGMQDEITGDLAKLAGMKVIGSQSTRSYLPGKERNLHAIGRDLGVRHLLEGTVSRDHDQMRVALHLVDLRDSGHHWTETYERPMKDVFALQSEITQAVAARLKARLSPNETVALNEPPTADLRAYDLYLRAQAINVLAKDTAEWASVAQQRISFLDQAVERDPKFVLAYCELAKAHDILYLTRQVTQVENRTVDHRALAEAALEKARRIQPDVGPVHLALAYHFLWANNDVSQAHVEIDLARRTMPNSAELETTAGAIARRQSRWDDDVRALERAVALEPRAAEHLFALANTYRLMRRYDRFDSVMTRLLGVLPPDRDRKSVV